MDRSTMEPAAKTTSKDLLGLEQKILSASSSLESTFVVCCNKEDNNSSWSLQNPQQQLLNHDSNGKLLTTPVPKSQFLDKAKNFLAILADANKRLEHDVKECSSKDYDIETLTGNEDEYIEMDLVLGVADLHTPEAVAAAQSAISGAQPVISLDPKTDGSDSESSDDAVHDSDENDTDSDGDCNDKTNSLNKPQEPNSVNGGCTSKSQPKKRQKIIELL